MLQTADAASAAPSARREPRNDRYIPLFWRFFVPNAAVLTAACVILIVEPANGRIPVLAGGLAVMLAVNMVLMRRAAEPLARLTALMRSVDPLRPGQRIPPIGPESEVTLVTTAFNEMLDRVERERRESARREIAAQESERRHVAVELHDQIGQSLTGMVFGLGRAIESAPSDVRSDLEGLREIAAETIEDVRRLAARLRPEVLDALGLEAALTNLCERFGRQTGLRVVPELQDGLPTLSAEAQLVVYRVAQESLTNVARHAGAQRAIVSLVRDGAEVLLSVSDDGRGSDGRREGGGIRGMRERALLLGAELDLRQGPAGGVEVRLRVPGEEIEW